MRIVVIAALLSACAAIEAHAECEFDVAGATMRLLADCTTDVAIRIPDGMTLDGANHTITAVDPPSGSFRGGIVVTAGTTASVINTRITAIGLASVCHPQTPSDDRLRGIFFRNASGLIRGNSVLNINQGASSCQEGNGIEVRTPVLSAVPVTVDISDNVVDGYQKTGIVIVGQVDATVRRNRIGASATQAHLAANALQVSNGAVAVIEHNHIAGNSWHMPTAAAAAILMIDTAPGTVVRGNEIEGNADVGIYVLADDAIIDSNRVIETGPDGAYDIGIGDWGEGNLITNNQVRGYATPYGGSGAGGKSDAGSMRQVE